MPKIGLLLKLFHQTRDIHQLRSQLRQNFDTRHFFRCKMRFEERFQS